MFTVDCKEGMSAPKRGDIFQTSIGDRRERTWLILKVRKVARKRPAPTTIWTGQRYQIWAARWWELEAEMRIALWRSAERNGGQQVIWFHRYPAKKKKSFEQYMGGV